MVHFICRIAEFGMKFANEHALDVHHSVLHSSTTDLVASKSNYSVKSDNFSNIPMPRRIRRRGQYLPVDRLTNAQLHLHTFPTTDTDEIFHYCSQFGEEGAVIDVPGVLMVPQGSLEESDGMGLLIAEKFQPMFWSIGD